MMDDPRVPTAMSLEEVPGVGDVFEFTLFQSPNCFLYGGTALCLAVMYPFPAHGSLEDRKLAVYSQMGRFSIDQEKIERGDEDHWDFHGTDDESSYWAFLKKVERKVQ